MSTKVQKAGHTLALNGITATAKIRRLKETNSTTDSTWRDKFSREIRLLSVHEARLRVAHGKYNQRAAQEEETDRVRWNAARDDATFTNRWLFYA